MTIHTATRPCWDCSACEAPWPCAPAKVDLAVEYAGQPTSLRIYLAVCLDEAAEPLAAKGATPTCLYERFIGWLPVDTDAELR
ncbi:hypothetical protein Sya03_57360 [Spirilliplanes yamanashiensis]|uniref:Flavin reductase n=1 Tax=Spirilliplanes yamanashiensis TaxID=42233 RepID=A0A8J3YEE1_9ACTN|nr:hypothetical protein Sya03_57360 [Spirilliplanes yamanashiensis]